MSSLTKEICRYCSKNISVGQIIIECDNCKSLAHGKCYKISGYEMKDDELLCDVCVKDHVQRYNPFKELLEDTDNPNTNYDNLESFQNINTILKSCKSYDKTSFNQLPYSSNNVSEKQLFSSYFLNIDGNLSNFDSFIAEIHQLKNAFSVIGLAETNCNPNNKDLYNITNYTSFYQNTVVNNGVSKKKGSGVAIYIHNSLNAIQDTSRSIVTPHIETLFLSITNISKPVTVGVVYRPVKTSLKQHYNFSKSNLENFVEVLSERVQNFSIVDNDFKAFQKIFTGVMDETCKLDKPKTTKRNNVNNPWITDGLVHSIETKHLLFKNWKKTVPSKFPKGNVEKLENYRTYNKRLKKLIKLAKSSYYSKKFEGCSGNMKKTWSLISEIRGKNKKEIKPFFKVGNLKVVDRRIIANKFNEYFVTLAQNMNNTVTDEISISGAEIPSFHIYMHKSVESSMFLSECTNDEILALIHDLEIGKASDIPVKLVKRCSIVITPILKQYYNDFMQTGYFPDILKVGKITPVFKKGDQEKFENYRPVSTLPIFGKLFEKIIYSRLYGYLTSKGILYDDQFGFRKSHSCSHALNYSISEIQKCLNDNKHVIGIYIDLSKAFDTIDHVKLLDKLHMYGVRGTTHSLLKSYLSNRLQYSSILGETSSMLPIPQGSVLGPLLFLNYINDLSNCSERSIFVLFADDTNIFVSAESIDDVYAKANSVLDSVYKYMIANQLHINMSKTSYMHFSPRKLDHFGLTKLFSEHSLELAGASIKSIRSTKFLGVVIDKELTWLPQIKKLSQKLNCQIGALNRIKDNIPMKFHKDLYFTLFESHLSYCVSVWGGVAPNKLEPLLITRKSCIRTLFGQHSFSQKCMTCARCRPLGKQTLDSLFYQKEHTKPLFKTYEILAIHNLYAYHCFIELFKILKFRQPYSLYESFIPPISVTRSTRHGSTYIHIPANISSPHNSFTLRSPKI